MSAAGPFGIRDTRARAFVVALAVAVILHLPFTPLPFILRWLGAYLVRSDTSWDYQDDSVIIPISLVENSPPPEKPNSAPEVSPPPAEGALPVAPKPAETRVRDAGAADAPHRTPVLPADAAPPTPKRLPDAEAPPADPLAEGPRDAGASTSPRGARSDGGADSGGERLAASVSADGGGASGAPATKDTLSLMGAGLHSAIKGKPNVALAFWFSTMRDHPLGPMVGGLLSCNPQWHDFLGDDVDPLQDFDAVMLAGPRMAETSKLTVLAQSRMEDAKVQKIMANLARRAGGAFLEGAGGSRAIRFHADRADRIALTHPRNMIIITPPEGFEQLRDQREPMSLPAGRGQAMSLTLVNPWRPFRGLGVTLPESLTELRVNVFAARDGVEIQIEFDDRDAASAAAHAREVTEQARANPLLYDMEFVAEDKHLAASTHLRFITSAAALGYIRSAICPAGGFDGGRGPR